MCHLTQNQSSVVGQGLAPLHFSNKEFEILELDPPINSTSHYGACYFRYNLALRFPFQIYSMHSFSFLRDDWLERKCQFRWILQLPNLYYQSTLLPPYIWVEIIGKKCISFVTKIFISYRTCSPCTLFASFYDSISVDEGSVH